MEKDQSLPQITKVWSIKSAFQCDFCHEDFRTIQSMKVHLRGHANKHKENMPPYFCQACSKAYLERDKLLEHIKHHYRSLKSSDLPSFKMNSSQPPKLTRFACGICSYTYSDKTTLKKHQEKAHSSEFKVKSYKCDLCGETVAKYQRSSHLRTVHPTYLKCDICNVSFATKRHLSAHQRNNHQKAVYGCRFCPQTFTSMDHLKFHEMRHSKEESHMSQESIENIQPDNNSLRSDDKQLNKSIPPKPSKTSSRFICRFCSNTYSTKNARNKHETKAHSSSKEVNTYKCDLCGEMVAKSQKIWHLRSMHPTHIERNKCDTCHKIFSDRHALNVHKISRCQSFLYVCRFCPETFAYVDHLRYHEMRHTDEEK